MAEVPLDILHCGFGKEAIGWVVFAWSMATLLLYPHTPLECNAVPLLELSRLILFRLLFGDDI